VVTRNLEPIYGLETAIRAVALVRAKLPTIRLKIAGSGPQGEELKRLVASLGLENEVSFLGRLDRAEIVALYHSAHAMLNPTRVDNMPNSVLEALACGVPVISTNVGGVPYIVEDGRTALLVTPGSEEEMAQAILRLCKDTELCRQLSDSGRREVAQYTWDKVWPHWSAVYNSPASAL
jgi:glycosyltransferase involved in cell wall biosynthesis